MDKPMRQFREFNPALYLVYREARVLNEAAGGGGGGGRKQFHQQRIVE